jgi:hypothetical protein
MLNLKHRIYGELEYKFAVLKEPGKRVLDALSYSVPVFSEIRIHLHYKEFSRIAEGYLFDERKFTTLETCEKLSKFPNYRNANNFVLLGFGIAKTISYSFLVTYKNPIFVLLILLSGLFEEKLLDGEYKNTIFLSKLSEQADIKC